MLPWLKDSKGCYGVNTAAACVNGDFGIQVTAEHGYESMGPI